MERELDIKLGRTPTYGDLASELQFDVSYIADLKRYQDKGLYVDGPAGADGNERTLGDLLPIHDTVAEDRERTEEQQALLNQALAEMLPDDIRIPNTNYSDILRRRFGLRTGQPQSYKEIAAIYRVGPEAIRIREKKALAKLRRKTQEILARNAQDVQ